jgi:hypothetical protein
MRNAIAFGTSIIVMAGLFAFQMLMAKQEEPALNAGVPLSFAQKLGFATAHFISGYWWILFPIVLGLCLLVASLVGSDERRR